VCARPWCKDEGYHRLQSTRTLLRLASGGLEEDLVADWLGMNVEKPHRFDDARDLIAAHVDGRTLIPALQFKDAMTILQMCEIYGVLLIKESWCRLRWSLTRSDALDGMTPLGALHVGRGEDAPELTRTLVGGT
jgi:hypothetical protein